MCREFTNKIDLKSSVFYNLPSRINGFMYFCTYVLIYTYMRVLHVDISSKKLVLSEIKIKISFANVQSLTK